MASWAPWSNVKLWWKLSRDRFWNEDVEEEEEEEEEAELASSKVSVLLVL